MEIQQGMREAQGITGFLQDAIADQIASDAAGKAWIEVAVERGNHDVVMRVRHQNIAEVRLGASVAGETSVQLILEEGSEVETVMRHVASREGVEPFHDPAINRLTAQAVAMMIMR